MVAYSSKMAYASYTTSSHTEVEEDRIIRYRDCKIVKNGSLVEEDVFIRKGKILNPKKLFFEERKQADIVFDCDGLIVSPGFIDIQVNGGFGHDFSRRGSDVFSRVDEVSRKLLKYGVTSFCPTIVTSPPSVYQEVLPQFCTTSKVRGANVLGVHLEGPFINVEKKGAHCADFIRDNVSPRLLEDCYGTLDNVAIVTLAPELRGSLETVEWLTKEKKIAVSLGHSMCDLNQAEEAVCHGASLITHLFNAMLPFHHRDPGLVGLLTSRALHEKPVYYGLIADNFHTHPAAIKIAYKSNSQGIVLVTDSIAATGLPDGPYKFGEQKIFVDSNTAKVEGTNILAGSVATMDVCVRNFLDATSCTKAEALEAASLHPAMALGIDDRKGKLDVGFDADLVLLEESTLKPVATVLAGRLVWIEDSLKKTWNLKNQ